MKKLFSRSLLALLLALCSTAGYAQKKVLCEDFGSTALPTGWTSSGNGWQFRDSEALFNAKVENGTDTLITPLVSVADLKNTPTVTMDYRLKDGSKNGTKVDKLSLLYRTAITEAWKQLVQFDTEQAELTRVYTQLPSDVTGNVQIAVAVVYNDGAATAIGYLAIENQRADIVAPTDFRYESLTGDNVTLLWNRSNSETFVQYNLKVSTTPVTDFSEKADAFDGSVKDPYATVGNLKANTQYYAYVRYESQDSDYSPWAELSFKTPCASVVPPYTENFEEGLTDCYTIIKESRRAEVSEAYPHNGTKAFLFLTNKNDYNYLFFPALGVDKVQDYQVSFYVASEVAGMSYGRDLTIGVAKSATADKFQELTTITLPKGRQWERVTLSLAGYKGDGKVIAFRAGSATSENHIFIDDVTIEKAEVCPRPMFVTISNVTYNSARIAWVEAGSATEWNVVIATKQYADPNDCEPDAAKGEYAGSVTKNPYEATNLKPQTTYYVYVQSACAEGNWTEVASFTTGKPVTLPYKEGFDRFDPDLYTNSYTAVPEQWVTGSRGLSQHLSHNYDLEDDADQASYISTTNDHTGSAYVPAALVLRGTSKSESGYYWTSYAMMPAMPDDVNKLILSFWAYSNNGEEARIVIGVADVQSNEIEQGKQLAPGGNVTPVDTLSFSDSEEWEEFTLNLSTYKGKGRYITFYVEPGEATPGIYIDDISIDYAPTCFAVQNLTATALSTNSFKATWKETFNATSWNIKVSSVEIDPATTDGDIVKNATVNTTPEYVATGLKANTTYYVYVTPTCGSLWKGTQVATLYAMTVPYYNDFSNEATGRGKAPKYWTNGNWATKVSTTSYYRPAVSTTQWSSKDEENYPIPTEIVKPSLKFEAEEKGTATSPNASQPYIVLPELTGVNVKDVTLSFWAWSSNYDYEWVTDPATGDEVKVYSTDGYDCNLKIGVMTDITDKSTLTEVTTVTVIGDTIEQALYFYVDMASYKGTGKYIVLYVDNQEENSSEIYIDNFSINLSSAPKRVSDLQVIDASTTQTSVKLKWHENGNAKQWKIRLFTEEQKDPSTATPVKEFTASDSSFTVTGLTHSTQYFAYVQAVNSNGGGAWSMVCPFWTKTGIWTVPFYESFNGYKQEKGSLPKYYEIIGNSEISVKSTYTPAVHHESRTNVLYIKSYSGDSVWFILPELDKPINTLQLTMDACGYSSDCCEQSTTFVGVVTADGKFHEVAKLQTSAPKVWENWFVDFNKYTGEKGRIAIVQDYSRAKAEKTLYICLEDIRVAEAPQCKLVTDIKTDKITTNSATILWTKAGEEAKWNLKVSTTPLKSPSDTTANVFDGQVDAVTKALTGLTPNTTYYVYVQSVRADKDCVGEWSKALSFTTLCAPMALPYTEDFEKYDNEVIPGCYTLSGDVTDTKAAKVGTITSYAGGKLLKIMQNKIEDNNYCALPEVVCDSINQVQLRMIVSPDYLGSATKDIEFCERHFYEVGIMTNPDDPTTFVSMFTDSIIADGTTVGKDKYYSFEKYMGGNDKKKGKFIAIKPLPSRSKSEYNGEVSESTGAICIDNVCIERLSSCIPPTGLKVVEFDNDTVTLRWAAKNTKGTFRVRIFDKPNANPDTDTYFKESVATDVTSATIKGLNGNTTYYAFVRKECSTTDYSAWSNYATWHTMCEDLQTLPYVETFEACAAKAVPNCWSQITDEYYSGQYGSNGTAEATVISSSEDGNYLCIYYGNGTQKKGAAKSITPRLNVESLKDIVIYFDARTSTRGKSVGLLIEAVESPAEDANAITITTIQGVKYDEWQTYYVDIADYWESAQQYQYLRFTPSLGTVEMDNIHFTTDKSVVIPVYGLTLQTLSSTNASFSFIEPVSKVKQWVVEYGPKDFALGTGTKQIVDTTVVALQGLAANTAYDVYVRANVQGAAAYTGPLTFTTLKAAATIPYNYNFGDAKENAELWTLINANAKGVEYPNTLTFGDASNVGATGTTALYVQHNGKYGYLTRDPETDALGNSADWAVRCIDIPRAGTYVFGVRAKNPGCQKDGSRNNAFMMLMLVPATNTPVAESIQRADGTSFKPTNTTYGDNEYKIIDKMYGINEYTDIANKVEIANPGTYKMLIYWQNWNSANKPGDIYEPVAIDSIWVEEFDCTEPSSHEIVAVTDTSATLSWFAGTNDKFEIIVSRYAKSPRPQELDEADMVAHKTFVGEPTFTVTGLKPLTSYAIYQRTICSDGPTAWHEVNFHTNCVEQTLPYTELFAEMPSCWHTSAGVRVQTEQYLTAEMEKAGEPAEEWNCLYMPMGGYVILPDFGVEANRLAIQMNVFNSTYLTNYEIGAVTSPYDMDSYQTLATLKTQYKLGGTSSDGNPYIIESFYTMLHRYKGTGHYIVIKADPGQVCYIKDLTVTLLPECVAPQMVEVTRITETTAQLSWIAGNETEWTVALNADTFSVTENPYILTNLKNGTDYSVSIRANCDATHASEWTIPVKFTTKCGVNSLPMLEDFEGWASQTNDIEYVLFSPNCWEQKYSKLSPDSLIRRPNANAFTAVDKTTNRALQWNVPSQEHLDGWFDGKAHLNSDIYADKSELKGLSKWILSPKYKIGTGTTLSFDLAVTTFVRRSLATNADTKDSMYVAVTKDGIKFDKVKTIYLNNYDSILRPVQVDLSQYEGETLMLVFCHKLRYNSAAWINTPSIRINNLRMNCMEVKNITETRFDGCGDYSGNGFTIEEDSLPILDESKTYTRFETSGDGCDKQYNLTLTTVKSPSVATVAKTICEGDYYEFGGHRISEPAPNGKAWRLSAPIAMASECDSVVYLYLTVNKMQPAIQKTIALSEAQLPWTDPDNPAYVIPIGATGTFNDTKRIGNTCQDCHYNVTIYPCVTVHTELPDTAICRGESVLFENKPYYPAKDTTFSVMKKQHDGCDSLITWHVKVNPVYSHDINVTICEGDSFLLGDTVLTTVGNYAYNFVSATGCDSIVTAHVEVIPVKTTSIVESICEGQSFRCAGEDFTESGSYERTLTSLTTGCDSIITLLLTVTPAPVVSQTATFCEGSTYDFNGTLLSKAGIYRDTTYTEKGCMSITELTLSMTPIKRTSLGTEYINKGEAYEFFGESLTATGSYSDTLQSAVTGCDSIVSVNLIVLTETTGHESMTVCAHELPITWKGQTITTEGVYQFDTLTTVGTDSTVLLSLHITQPVKVGIHESVCEGGKYQFGDTTLTTAGTYTRTIPSLLTGCDSVITLHLTITPANVETREANICNGGSYDFNGKIITRAGIYRDTVRSVDGCMSITELILAINNSDNTIIYESICQGGKYQFGDTTLTTAGTYTRTSSSLVTGCDGTITLVLTVTPAAVERKSVAICEGDAYDFNGKKLVAAGVYRDTIRSEEGCMSITELALTVNKPVSKSITETICEGIKYPLADTIVTTAGTHVRTTPSLVTGCDSTITLTLYVIPAEVAKATIPICEGHPYDFNGKLLSEAGTYRDTTYTKDGCMAISEVEIVVNKPVAETVNKTICEGSKYQFVDTTLTTAGTYYRTIASKVTGCDSVITLNLAITPAPVEKVTETICEGATHQLGSKSLTTAGVYRDTTTVEGGCMSITELTLSVTPAPVENKTAEICEDATFDFAGKQLNTAGTYRDTTYAAETHCMTITELILTVNEIATINVDTTIHIEELPFVYKVNEVGYMILPENTDEGTYEKDTVLVPGSCTSYHFNITVKTTDAVDNIDVPSLHIYPTLIDKGQSVNLILDAAPANNNVVVEIHDMVGQLVATYRPASSHVILGDFHTAGMYFVRVLTDDTVSGVGRVVVK